MAEQRNEALLRMSTVRTMTGLARSSIYELEKRGLFPHRVALSERSVAWRASEVQAWIEGRARKVTQ